MRLRRKPWVDEAILAYSDFVSTKGALLGEECRGGWSRKFKREAPLYVELGVGKGDFLSQMGELCPHINFLGLEAQQDVLFSAAQKVADKGLTNVRLLVFDANRLEEIFAPGEIDRLYINFCDPWPKRRHAKRRLTSAAFLRQYRLLLKVGGEIHFKTDNRPLFDFSLGEFKALGLKVKALSYDLHGEGMPSGQVNIMTEYERKFSALGEKICRCEVEFS